MCVDCSIWADATNSLRSCLCVSHIRIMHKMGKNCHILHIFPMAINMNENFMFSHRQSCQHTMSSCMVVRHEDGSNANYCQQPLPMAIDVSLNHTYDNFHFFTLDYGDNYNVSRGRGLIILRRWWGMNRIVRMEQIAEINLRQLVGSRMATIVFPHLAIQKRQSAGGSIYVDCTQRVSLGLIVVVVVFLQCNGEFQKQILQF